MKVFSVVSIHRYNNIEIRNKSNDFGPTLRECPNMEFHLHKACLEFIGFLPYIILLLNI